MRNLTAIRRARDAALELLLPFVEASRQRFGGIPPTTWRQPYVIGYITMLISLGTQGSSATKLTQHQIGQTQIRAWSEITGHYDPAIGEDILVLSASANPAFLEGCRNAAHFFAACHGYPDPEATDLTTILAADYLGRIASARETSPIDKRYELGLIPAALWSHYFDDYVDSP